MDENTINHHIYCFAEFRLNSATEQLFKGREVLKIEPQLYALLWLFVQNPAQVVSKQIIEQQVWAGRPVSDEALRAAMKKLRDVLDDDARSPRFIKTIPKQGYKWLSHITLQNLQSATSSDTLVGAASVSPSSPNTPENSTRKVLKTLPILIFCVLGIALASLIFFFHGQPDMEGNEAVVPVITPITQLPGSEVDADYHAQSNKLAFIHRDARNSPQQLYIKDLNSGAVTRLSWDKANYSNSYWSNDGKKLVFTRLLDQKHSTHIAHFLEDGSVQRLQGIDTALLANKFILDWLPDDSGFLLAEEIQPNKQHGIFALDFASNSLKTLSNPNVAGRGDFKASISRNNDLLAILREEVPGEATLLVTSLATGDSIAKTKLPFFPNRMIWTENQNGLAMSNFFGEHWHYDIESGELTDQPVLPENSLDLFATCGEHCYVLRQHNGNFLDLQETPLSTLASRHVDAKTTPIIDGGRLLRRANAQDFPQYLNSEKSLFFVTLQGKDFVFQRLDEANKIHDIATLDRNAQLSSVAVSPDGTTLVGAANGRLFRASIENTKRNTPEVTYITSALERYGNPIWDFDNRHLYVTQLTGNRPDIVRFDLDTQKTEVIAQNLLAFAPMPDTTDKALAISADLDLVSLTKSEQQWQVSHNIGKVSSASPNRWRLADDSVYFTRHQLPEAFLCKLDINKAAQQQDDTCWSIGDNRFRLNFDINPQSQKIMLVESLSAESDIVKMRW